MTKMLLAIRLALVIPTVAWRGWVLTKLWAWFIVGAFGADPLRLVDAIGISLVVGYLTTDYPFPSGKPAEAVDLLLWDLIVAAVVPACALAGGWIYWALFS